MRTHSVIAICAAIAFGAADAASAKDGRGRGRDHGGDYYAGYARDRGEYRDRDKYKEEFYSQGCKVKREWKRDRGYKEEVKCDGHR